MATVYVSEAIQAAVAQQLLDDHTTLIATGLCLTCELPGPCPWWEAATAAFTRTGRLPRRTPGWTRPQLLGARRLTPTAAGEVRR